MIYFFLILLFYLSLFLTQFYHIKFYNLLHIVYRNSSDIKMLSPILIALTLYQFFYFGQAFVQLIPQFNASSIGSNVIVHDAILVNSSQNLIISYNQNGNQYISKYAVQAGRLVLQISLPTTTYNPLLGQPISVLCVNSLQTQVMVFTLPDNMLYLLDINTLSAISTMSTFINICQMIWSPVNNNIYIVDNIGNYGYLSYIGANTWNSNFIFPFFPAGALRMSVSPNFTYMAISCSTFLFIYIFDMTNNNLYDTPSINELNTVAHQWFDNDLLYVMSPTTGYLTSYNVSSTIVNQYSCLASGIYNVFSFHMHRLSNSSIQYVIGSSSGTTISFLQLNILSFTIVNTISTSYSQNLAQIKYSITSPQKGLLIFNSFIDTIDILQQCYIGYSYDSSSNKCALNSITTSLSLFQQQFLINLILMITQSNFLQTCNKVPGNRRLLQPFFIFFVNLDDMQLYIYHQRHYDFVLDNLLSSIQTLQNQKWSTLQFEDIFGFMGINATFIKENLNTKVNYTSWKFYQVQGYSSGFIVNTLNFFLSNIFLIFFIFLILRKIFFLLFKFQISKFLRQYSLWPYLYFMMIDGNLQFLSYMYLCELQHFFSPNFSNKCGLVFMIGIFLVLILLISCSHLLLRQTYGILAKYFFEDTKTSIQASIYLILQFGYRNFILGVVHAIFNHIYTLKISLLLTIQILFLLNSLFFLRKRNFFINQTRITVNSISALVRICMIFIFLINPSKQSDIQEMTTIDIILQKSNFIMVIVYLLLGTSSTFFQICKMVYQILYFIRDKQKKQTIDVIKCEELVINQVSSKQRKTIKQCIFQQVQLKSNTSVNQNKIQPVSKDIKQKNIKKFILKKNFSNLFKITQVKQPQISKEVQNVIFPSIKQNEELSQQKEEFKVEKSKIEALEAT